MVSMLEFNWFLHIVTDSFSRSNDRRSSRSAGKNKRSTKIARINVKSNLT